ncbi:MAG TPA: ATP-binding protein [Chloroflexia bacterium]
MNVRLNCEMREERAWAVITVQDEGPGIPADILPRLFTRYAAGAESTGLGLGLYLAHNNSIVAAHDGTPTAESEPGRGATFRMSLPLISAIVR